MDTLGPVSVLDSGRRTRDALVADRVTRRRSPDRPRLKAAHSDLDVVYRIPQPYRTSFSARHSVERLPGSDRSRSLSPTSSLRSTQSCRSDRIGRLRLGRAKSPKRVTYDTRVTIRHSDAEDSMFGELSSRELESSSSYTQNLKSHAQSPSLHTSQLSRDSGLDYSLQLRDLSDQIIKMEWAKDKDSADSSVKPLAHADAGGCVQKGVKPNPNPPSILKESQNSHHKNAGSKYSPPPPLHPAPSRTPQASRGDKENTPNGSPPPQSFAREPAVTPKTTRTISRDYQHDRTLSYRRAISDHYSSEVRALVDAGIEEKPPSMLGRENGGLLAQQRSSSVTAVSRVNQANTSSQLTPAKRSVSTSISNFFKRISPHLGRKRSKDRAGSSQSLPATSGVTVDREGNASGVAVTPDAASPTTAQAPSAAKGASSSSSHFSRSMIRNSFLKLVGGKESKSKLKSSPNNSSPQTTADSIPSPEYYSIEPRDGSTISDDEFKQQSEMPESAQRVLKSMERNSLGKKDVYHEFKSKRSSPQSATAEANLEERYRAIKAQYSDRPPSQLEDELFDSYDGSYSVSRAHAYQREELEPHATKEPSRVSPQLRDGADQLEGEDTGSRVIKAEPPSSLDVVPPRAIHLLQTSIISTISGDESIGECSLDCNLTASEPSLLSGNSQSAGSTLSKKAVLNQSILGSTDSQPPLDSASTTAETARTPRRQKDALVLGQELLDSVARLNKEYGSPLSPLSPTGVGGGDPSRKPSYLKLSCAVSGYGKYSRYSSYKSIPSRSPFSSTSSLRSDLSSPDLTMPSLRSPDDLGLRSPGLGLGGGSPSGAAVMARALSNGQSRLAPALNGHGSQAAGLYPTGDAVKDGEYFLDIMSVEEDRLNQQAKQAEGMMRSQDLPEEVNGKLRAAIGKSNLLIGQKFQQFRDLCSQHMHPEPEDRVPLWEDLQGFWDMTKIQVENVDDMFAEIEHMSQNGWKEIPRMPSRRSSASSSPKSAGSLSQASTPSATPGHTPGSKRRGLKPNGRETPESSPEHAQKIRSAAKARDEARKKMLAEKRAAMKQQQQKQQDTEAEVEIFVPEEK